MEDGWQDEISGHCAGSNDQITGNLFPEVFEIMYQVTVLFVEKFSEDQQAFACLGQNQRFLPAVDKADAEFLLEFLDLK